MRLNGLLVIRSEAGAASLSALFIVLRAQFAQVPIRHSTNRRSLTYMAALSIINPPFSANWTIQDDTCIYKFPYTHFLSAFSTFVAQSIPHVIIGNYKLQGHTKVREKKIINRPCNPMPTFFLYFYYPFVSTPFRLFYRPVLELFFGQQMRYARSPDTFHD